MDCFVAHSLATPLSIDIFGVSISESLFAGLGVLAIAVLIGLSAFFSSSEIAMFSLADHRVDSLAEESTTGQLLQRLRSDPHRLLVTILVGNNLVNIAMSSIATGLFGLYLTQGQSVVAATFGVIIAYLGFRFRLLGSS